MAKSAAKYVFVFIEIFEREGGIQSYVKDVLRAYAALPNPPQADVFLLRDSLTCANPFRDTPCFQFHYFRSAQAWLGRLRLITSLVVHLVQHRPSHVICGHILLAPLIKALCQALRIPYTVMTYGKEVWFPLSASAKSALYAAQSIWTISRYSGDLMAQANQVPKDKIHLLPCMVDDQVFTPGPKRAEWVERYGLHDALVLMTVARLWSGDIYKGVDVTLRALPAIADAFPSVKYLVIGRGDDQPRLAQLAVDLGVADRVIFAGFVPTESLADHYRLADAYIMPSQEGFGIVYLEAMACGVPVLSGDNDGSADPLQDGRMGWRVPHRDPEAVAAACIEILQGDDPRCDGQWLRQETLAHFSRDSLSRTLKGLLSDC